jgi:hypothetical protein
MPPSSREKSSIDSYYRNNGDRLEIGSAGSCVTFVCDHVARKVPIATYRSPQMFNTMRRKSLDSNAMIAGVFNTTSTTLPLI